MSYWTFAIVLLSFTCCCQAEYASNPTSKNFTSGTQRVYGKEGFSEYYYKKAYSFMKVAKAFRNYTYEQAVDLINYIDEWDAPQEWIDRFPYYMSGYDFDDKPIWVSEAGKYKVDDIIDRVFELYPIFEKMVYKGALHVLKSFVDRDGPGKDIRQVVGLVDCEGVDVNIVYKLIPRVDLLDLGLKLADLYFDLAVAVVGQVILVNANYATKLAIDIAKPIAGNFMDRVVVLGANKYRWKAELRRLLPEEAIPTWYGGPKDFKPVAVYG